MVPGMFSTPPPIGQPSDSPREARAGGEDKSSDAMLVAFAVFLAGIVGFLGFLIAGSLIPRAATPLRVLALTWFAVFGIWHLRTSAKIS
jgi:hypothetical protein